MVKKIVFFKNAAVLTASSLILRLLGIYFKVRLAALIGAEGIGLYQLIFSFYIFVSSFAASGICTAVTRLVADETALGQKRGVHLIFDRCILLTLLIAGLSAAGVFFGAPFLAERLLGDARAVPALKMIALSLPFMGVSSCLRGYFIARRNAAPTAITQIIEQLVRVLLVFRLIAKFAHRGLTVVCGAVLFGDTAASAVSVLLLYLCYRKDGKKLDRLSGRERPPYGITEKILHIALPITAGRYLNGALRTAENITVPRRLRLFSTGKTALSQFGMIKGMALPILFFPSTLLNTLSTLLIPEISEAAARGNKALLRETARRVLQITALLSFLFAAVFRTSGYAIGRLLYHSEDVGYLLRVLAPIVPLMYLDSVSDGILKGLDQQKFSFKVGLADSLLRLILIVPVLPRYGMKGFIVIMYFSNILTCALNVGRVVRLCGIRPRWSRTVLLPISAAGGAALLFEAIFRPLFLPDLWYTVLLCGITVPLYALALFSLGCISRGEIADLVKR